MTAPAPAPGETLSERLVALLARPVGAADRERAALHLLDWLGGALAGAETAVGRRVAAPHGGHPFGTVGAGDPLPMGALGSLLEMDDVHRAALLHPPARWSGPRCWPKPLDRGMRCSTRPRAAMRR